MCLIGIAFFINWFAALLDEALHRDAELTAKPVHYFGLLLVLQIDLLLFFVIYYLLRNLRRGVLEENRTNPFIHFFEGGHAMRVKGEEGYYWTVIQPKTAVLLGPGQDIKITYRSSKMLLFYLLVAGIPLLINYVCFGQLWSKHFFILG